MEAVTVDKNACTAYGCPLPDVCQAAFFSLLYYTKYLCRTQEAQEALGSPGYLGYGQREP